MLQVDGIILKDVIKHSLAQRRPLMIWGIPGIGKSQEVSQVSDEMGAMLMPIHLSQYDSVDLRGIPSVQKVEGGTGHMTVWQPPKVLPFVGNPAFPTDVPIIIFLDELPQAMAAVQAPAMQLVLEQRIGEHELMPNVLVLAAGNLETHKSGSNAMLAALRNRFRHVELTPDIKAWAEWAHGAGIEPKLISFLQFRPTLLSGFHNEDGKVTDDKAFPTPRTWEWVSKTLTNSKISREMQLFLNTGDVGIGPAGEIQAFMELFDDMPDMVDLFKNARTAEIPDPKKPAMMYAISTAIAVYCDTPKKFRQIGPYIERMPIEYGMRTIKDTLTRHIDLTESAEFNEFAVKHQELFAAD